MQKPAETCKTLKKIGKRLRKLSKNSKICENLRKPANTKTCEKSLFLIYSKILLALYGIFEIFNLYWNILESCNITKIFQNIYGKLSFDVASEEIREAVLIVSCSVILLLIHSIVVFFL